MLTRDCGGPDGGKREYLSGDDNWSEYDQPLFVSLKQTTDPKKRDVSYAERWGILPTAKVFFTKWLPAECTERRAYFQEFLSVAREAGSDLVFFDPDNGLEVPSEPYRMKRSTKHLYSDELWCTFARGHSILLYQHFGRQKRERFICDTAQQLCWATGASDVFSFRTSNVVFFLVPQASHHELFQSRASQVRAVWGNQIRVPCNFSNRRVES